MQKNSYHKTNNLLVNMSKDYVSYSCIVFDQYNNFIEFKGMLQGSM